jgi:hypothetical protein
MKTEVSLPYFTLLISVHVIIVVKQNQLAHSVSVYYFFFVSSSSSPRHVSAITLM